VLSGIYTLFSGDYSAPFFIIE